MKKLLAVVLSLSLLLAGCGSSENKSEVKFDSEGFIAKTVEKLTETDDMVELSEDKLGDFYSVPFEGLKKATVYVSGTRATSNEVCVLELENADAEAAAKEAVEKRLEEQKASYKDYIPSEYEKLTGSMTSVQVVGNNVIFVAGLESADVDSLITEFTEK